MECQHHLLYGFNKRSDHWNAILVYVYHVEKRKEEHEEGSKKKNTFTRRDAERLSQWSNKNAAVTTRANLKNMAVYSIVDERFFLLPSSSSFKWYILYNACLQIRLKAFCFSSLLTLVKMSRLMWGVRARSSEKSAAMWNKIVLFQIDVLFKLRVSVENIGLDGHFRCDFFRIFKLSFFSPDYFVLHVYFWNIQMGFSKWFFFQLLLSCFVAVMPAQHKWHWYSRVEIV